MSSVTCTESRPNRAVEFLYHCSEEDFTERFLKWRPSSKDHTHKTTYRKRSEIMGAFPREGDHNVANTDYVHHVLPTGHMFSGFLNNIPRRRLLRTSSHQRPGTTDCNDEAYRIIPTDQDSSSVNHILVAQASAMGSQSR